MNYLQIKQLINSFSEEEKADLLEEIKLKSGVSMFIGKPVRRELLNYAVALLNGESPPTPKISHHRSKGHNGRVIVVRESYEETD